MKFLLQLNQALPKLGWFARIDHNSGDVFVVHGEYVEIGDDFIIEGVWNGEFAEGSFGETDCIFGSGLIARDGEIIVVSSVATTDSIYYQEAEDSLTVANSLPLLLAVINDRLDPAFLEYDKIINSTLLGIYRYQSEFPTVNGAINYIQHWNLRIANGITERFEKKLPPKFTDYSDYFMYLTENYGRIADNAHSTHRKWPMKILSTQSRGYDSTAVNAIAAPYGIDMAYTVKEAKGKGAWVINDKETNHNDDGTQICEKLNIPCKGVSRRSFEGGFENEALFHAATHNNEDANLLELISDVQAPSMLLTGVLGELWYTTEALHTFTWAVDRELQRADVGMHGLKEVRLRAGFVQVPVPYIGARSRPEIYRITLSDEMKPWSLNQIYDRPIARRIAEDAGVPRELFGQVKMASAAAFPIPSLPYTPLLREEYLDFLQNNKLITGFSRAIFPIIQGINQYIHFHSPTHHRAIYYIERAVSKMLRRKFEFQLIYKNLRGSLFCFCVNKTSEQYKLTLT